VSEPAITWKEPPDTESARRDAEERVVKPPPVARPLSALVLPRQERSRRVAPLPFPLPHGELASLRTYRNRQIVPGNAV